MYLYMNKSFVSNLFARGPMLRKTLSNPYMINISVYMSSYFKVQLRFSVGFVARQNLFTLLGRGAL